MRLRIALGHALWYVTPESDAPGTDPLPAHWTLPSASAWRSLRAQALWGLWAARRSRERLCRRAEVRHTDTRMPPKT